MKLGSKVTDVITGFQGVVTGKAEYISGCSQALVVPPVTSDGAYREGQWFDVQRLLVDNTAPNVTLANGDTPGCDRQAPKR